jgi:hypothetical protein
MAKQDDICTTIARRLNDRLSSTPAHCLGSNRRKSRLVVGSAFAKLPRMTEVTAPAKPPIPLLQLAILTAALTLAVFVLRIVLIEPWNTAIVPKGLAVLPFAALFAFGLSVVITLAVANRHRWRVVLRPNRGRVIGAIALALVTPLAIFSWLPSILGGWLVVWVMLATSKELVAALEFFIFSLTFFLLAAALWYPIACLIVSGLTSRWARVAVFSLMYLSAYSAIMLVLGTQIFRL